MFFRPTNWDN